MRKRLTAAQRLQMLEMIQAVNEEWNRDNLDSLIEDAPDWMMDWPIWSAGENMPGYLPDSPYCLFLTKRAAVGECNRLDRARREELERGEEDRYVSDYLPTTLREAMGG